MGEISRIKLSIGTTPNAAGIFHRFVTLFAKRQKSRHTLLSLALERSRTEKLNYYCANLRRVPPTKHTAGPLQAIWGEPKQKSHLGKITIIYPGLSHFLQRHKKVTERIY